MQLASVLEIWAVTAGGPGSGCKGETCGRPKGSETGGGKTAGGRAGRLEKSLRRSIGRASNPKVFAYTGGKDERWNEDRNRLEVNWRPDSNSRHKLFADHGVTAKGYQDFQQTLFGWSSGNFRKSSKRIEKAAEQLQKGEVSSSEVKALMVEREITQAILRKGGRDSITLYRGVSGAMSNKIEKTMKKNKEFEIQADYADSWTESIDVAEGFSVARGRGVALEVKVPISAVLTSHRTNSAFKTDFGNEREFVVSFPQGKFNMRSRNVGLR